MRALIFSVFLGALSLDQALADQADVLLNRMLGTTQVVAQPYYANGTLSGCHYVFTAFTRDFVYRKGQYLKVDGSIGIVTIGGKLGTTLKVVVNELDGNFNLTPSPPSRAYLIAENYQNNLNALVSAEESDTPGALFSIFNIDPSIKIILAGTSSSKLVIAFNRKGGQSDVLLPLELNVDGTDSTGNKLRSDEAPKAFANCMVALLNADK